MIYQLKVLNLEIYFKSTIPTHHTHLPTHEHTHTYIHAYAILSYFLLCRLFRKIENLYLAIS